MKHFAAEEMFLFNCNREKANRRMVFHACLHDTPVIMYSDVLLILIHAYAIKQPTHNWYMKIDHNKFVDIRKIVSHLRLALSLQLPCIHGLTGCDTTSYMYNVGKVLRKLIKYPTHVAFLDGIGKDKLLKTDDIAAAQKFVQTVCYISIVTS